MYWSRSGNTIAGGSNNIFGTQFNSPIYTITGGLTSSTYRTKLNGDFNLLTQASVNGYGWNENVNTSGYMLLGYSGTWANSLYAGNSGRNGAYSLLHLNGRDGTFVQNGGYRPWMKTGIGQIIPE